MLRPALLAALLLLGPGCLGTASATTAVAPSVSSSIAIPRCVDDFCSEASISAAPEGRLYVADGYGESLASSGDGGVTWTPMRAPGFPSNLRDVPGAQDSDSLVYATPRGRVVFSSLAATYNSAPTYIAGAATLLGLHVAVSNDEGKTWANNVVLGVGDPRQTALSDRQWVVEGPHGELYLSYTHWRGTPLFYAYAGPAYAPGTWADDAIEVARSDDGGATWSDFVPVSHDDLSFTQGGVGSMDATGALVVPALQNFPDGSSAVSVFRSTDGGKTFTRETVEAAPADPAVAFPNSASAPGGIIAMGWARASGAIAVATRAPSGTWGAPMTWTLPGENATVGPWIVPRAGGGFALSYVTVKEEENKVYGDLRLAWGDTNGVAGRATLESHFRIVGQGANGDFTNLATLPDGRFASAMAEYDNATRTFSVRAFVTR